ncbi:hypothetical protein D3C84_694700 [compost metagenome]
MKKPIFTQQITVLLFPKIVGDIQVQELLMNLYRKQSIISSQKQEIFQTVP